MYDCQMNIHEFKRKYGTKTLGLLVQRLICESGFADPHENAENLELIEMTVKVVTDLELALDQMDARALVPAGVRKCTCVNQELMLPDFDCPIHGQ